MIPGSSSGFGKPEIIGAIICCACSGVVPSGTLNWAMRPSGKRNSAIGII
jgi:hypothetical protein